MIVTPLPYALYAPQGLIAAFAAYDHVVCMVAVRTGNVLIEGKDLILGDNKHLADSAILPTQAAL